MGLIIDNDGTISIYQGDTGNLVVNGLNTDKNYYVYLSIRDKKHNLVGTEQVVTSNNNASVSFFLNSALTNLLTVPANKQYETYYYGIKITEVGSNDEDTLFIGDKDYGEQNLILVYPKQVEGTV